MYLYTRSTSIQRTTASVACAARQFQLGTTGRLLPSYSKRSALSVGGNRSQYKSTVATTHLNANVSDDGKPSHAAAANPHYPTLFSPLKLPNGVVLSNRVLMGSMHTGLEGHSIPSWFQEAALGLDLPHVMLALVEMAEYFKERVEGGVGLMVTGGIAPNWVGWTGPFAAKLSTREEMMYHRIVTEYVHDADANAKICMQILHTGRYAYHPFAVSASSTKSPISPFRARALSKSGIRSTIKDFVNCATLAQEARYDGVEIMASEGYLLSQFLSPRTNFRTDEYGGASLENRARLPLEILRQIRQATGDDFIIIFRLSLLDLVEGGLQWDECVQLAQWIQEGGATILNTGIGWHEARIPTIATSVPRAAFVHPTRALKETGLIHIPIVATNRINAPQVAEDILSSHASDLVSMARPLLADPDFLKKAKDGLADEINTCIACNQACLDHAFVGKRASCLVNPRAGHELFLTKPTMRPTDERKTIGIIGAGPAGCAFAITAAQRGHDVTLYDAGPAIGGQFHMAKRVPGKEEFNETLRYFRTMLQKTGVNVQLNTTVTMNDMTEKYVKVDKWIVATGVLPRSLDIPGADHPNVLSYIDVLKHNAPVGQKVAVIGAGGIGFDVSEFLLHHNGTDKQPADVNIQDFWTDWGVDPSNTKRGGLVEKGEMHHHPAESPRREIVLLQRKKGKLGSNLGRTTGWIHRATLTKSGAVEMVGGVTYDKVDENGHLHITNHDGTKRVLEVDNIVVCAGQLVQNELEKLAKGTGLESKVYTIGGAFEAGELDAKRAIDMGTRLAMDIHQEEVVPGKHKIEAPPGAEEKMYEFLRKWI